MLRKIILFGITALLLTPVIFQVMTMQASADHLKTMTSPVTFFNLVGQVTYRQVGNVARNVQRVLPADDIKVVARPFFGGEQEYTTTTDPNGVYSFNLPEGLYRITVEDDPNDRANFFVPPLRVDRVNDHRADRANFQGLIFSNRNR